MKQVWNWLDGKKTAISVLLLMTLKGVNLLFPDLIKPEISDWLQDIFLYVFGGIGVGDKLIKKYQNGTRNFQRTAGKKTVSVSR